MEISGRNYEKMREELLLEKDNLRKLIACERDSEKKMYYEEYIDQIDEYIGCIDEVLEDGNYSFAIDEEELA